MSPVRVTFGRTLGKSRSCFSTALAVAGFLAATAAALVFNLQPSEGGDDTFAMLWAVSASPFLPVLAAFLSMDVWSGERRSGRIDMLLATAVRERDFVIGKFLGVWFVTALSLLLSLALGVAGLWLFAPAAFARVGLAALTPAVVGLCIQGALWCAVSVAASAMCSHMAASASLAVALTVGLPRGVWAGLRAWSSAGSVSFGAVPVDAHALDMASGVFPVGVVGFYMAGAAVSLFIATKCVLWTRFPGRGGVGLRLSTAFSVFLSLVTLGLAAWLAFRLDTSVDLALGGPSTALSPRTRSVLTESGGEIAITCVLPRDDPKFKSVSRFLRQLKRQSESMGGARIILQYVDPRWDIGAAERLVARGVVENGLVFERGRRMVAVSFREGFGERVCASAISRLTMTTSRRNVYWTVGHGERSFDDYGAFGMSDIARDLSRVGYRNRTIDLASAQQIPGDCALIVIAGAKDAFSRAELGRLDAYLHEGGRLLVLLGSSAESGIGGLLPSWGLRPVSTVPAGAATQSGSDVIVSEFAEHPVSSPLRGSRILLERPLVLESSAAADVSTGADRIEFVPLAQVGRTAVAALAERGANVGADLAIRPTRIVAVGDASFAMNGALASRANANRDFFLNCAAYLSGTDVIGSVGDEAGPLVTGLDRSGRFRHMVVTVVVFPGAVFLLLAAEVIRRRRRS